MGDVRAERPHQDAVGDEGCAYDYDPVESEKLAAAQGGASRSAPQRVESSGEKQDHQRGHARDSGPEHVSGAEQDLAVERGRGDQGNEDKRGDDDSQADPACAASSITAAAHCRHALSSIGSRKTFPVRAPPRASRLPSETG